MKNRRTIRQYADKAISEEMLQELLAVAARASNTGNMQLYSVVVTRSAEGKASLAPAHFNQPMITTAPVVLTICADTNRFVKWAEQRQAEAGFDNLQTFMAATLDATIFAQSFCDAAEARGLGICYLGTTTYNADQIIRVLQLPERVVPVVTLTVGYPAEKESLPVNQQFVKDNGKETLAQVFTDVRYTKAANEHFSEVFRQVLKDQKFL